jgi:potassium-transporting ATPase KdpC subunit
MKMIRPALTSLVILTLITGLVYPVAVTGLAQMLFPAQAKGSLITRNGSPVGSSLIGQPFDDPKYFWGRPSATQPFPYNAAASAGSNLGPSNPALFQRIQTRVALLRATNSRNEKPIPIDLVTASGSGLDPHISLAAAEYQVQRVARARRLNEAKIRELVVTCAEGRQLGLLGEPRVNVLRLNLALDELR